MEEKEILWEAPFHHLVIVCVMHFHSHKLSVGGDHIWFDAYSFPAPTLVADNLEILQNF
jgi:hypothetical protein